MKSNAVGSLLTPTRRVFLTMATAQSIALPAACAVLYDTTHTTSAQAAPAQAAEPAPSSGHKGGLRPEPASDGVRARIVRDFAHPRLELIRLLHEAAEIEHALMVQYLYAAFSLKPEYELVRGAGAPSSPTISWAWPSRKCSIWERSTACWSSWEPLPIWAGRTFRYEPDLYPFPFHLEPLSRHSLAKYVFTEAPENALDPKHAKSDEDHPLPRRSADRNSGEGSRPNHVGTLYGTIIDLVSELEAMPGASNGADLAGWKAKLEDIKGEGEVDHYHFFRNLFMGQHAGFDSAAGLEPAADDAAYPSYQLPLDPSAYTGHPNRSKTRWPLGWHGSAILNTGPRCACSTSITGRMAMPPSNLARAHMLGPLWSLATHLPKLGTGMPFDPLSLGYAPGRTPRARACSLPRSW